MRAEDIPLKRNSNTCHGIATYCTRPFIVPTQGACWYLPWDCYLLRASIHCSHSRVILILAVGLLPIVHVHSLFPLKRRHSDLSWDCYLLCASIHCSHSRGILILAMELLLILSLAHSTSPSRGNTVICVKALSIFTLVVTVNYSGHKPPRFHQETILWIVVNLSLLLIIFKYIIRI